MATVYGVNRTKMNSPSGSNILDQGINKSNVCFMYDEYEASALAENDVIQVCDVLPRGAVITRIDIATDDLGTGATIDVGDATTVDKYVDGLDVSTSAVHSAYPELVAEIASMGYQITGTADDQLQITLLGSVATGTIKVFVQYAI